MRVLLLKIHYLVKSISGDCLGRFCCPIAYSNHKDVYFHEINFLAHETKSTLSSLLWNTCDFGGKHVFPPKPCVPEYITTRRIGVTRQNFFPSKICIFVMILSYWTAKSTRAIARFFLDKICLIL